jgi:hypothetical protein
MRTFILAASAAVAIAGAPALATADTYSTASFSGGVFGGNANAKPPFDDANIFQGMTFSGSFLIDNTIVPGPGFENVLFSSYPDDAAIPDAVNLSFALGDLAFDSSTTSEDGVQYNNGAFNGFTYTADFSYQGTGYNLTIAGGTFSIINAATFETFVNGYINVGNQAVTDVTPYEVPGPGGPGVPEPTTWAMMILGFGATGSLLRRSRKLTLV